MNFPPRTYIYCENLRVNQPLKVTFSGMAVAVKSDGAKLYAI